MEKTRTEGDLRQEHDQQQLIPRRLMASENHQEHPAPPPRKCPRCDSGNTKFCYYNNYSLSQPRYFCKSCRRYWTHGGALRNVPVGGGCRKSKRTKPSYAPMSSGEAPRIGSSSPAIITTYNPRGMMSGQSIRSHPLPIPSMSSLYSGGGPFLSSMAAMQSFMQQPTIGTGQGAAMNLAIGSRFRGGGPAGGCGNAAPLPEIYLPSLKPPAPQQFSAQNELYQSQQSLISPSNPVLNSWTQTVINSRASPAFWCGGGTGDITGDHTSGPSMNPNPWSEYDLPGIDPSQ
ncbi:hypothetical protein F511_21491 [Dorcoceras hygrometricum]|uniref:Dof zinc finger protein n=1 Tax=Dorcoceras hygrometricum TaxID=472368 RepID=A0A2Z7D175_9LAMI|nr:hypothetical protein F511_21491 [Dorcoceras hygrometricum]